MPLESLLSVTQYAALRGISRARVWQLIDSGRLTIVQIGGKIFIDRYEIPSPPPPRGEAGRRGKQKNFKLKEKE